MNEEVHQFLSGNRRSLAIHAGAVLGRIVALPRPGVICEEVGGMLPHRLLNPEYQSARQTLADQPAQ